MDSKRHRDNIRVEEKERKRKIQNSSKVTGIVRVMHIDVEVIGLQYVLRNSITV